MKGKRIIYSPKENKELFLLLLAGALAGFCNGLLGAGGGIIIVFFLMKLLPKGDNESARSVYSNALLVMFPLSVLTLSRYIGGGAIVAENFGMRSLLIFLGAVIGGAVGGALLGKIRGPWLKRIFALLTLVSGVIMVVK